MKIYEVYAFSPSSFSQAVFLYVSRELNKNLCVWRTVQATPLHIHFSTEVIYGKQPNNFPLTNAEQKAIDVSLIMWQ